LIGTGPNRTAALLLIGPTGSGKSPLGDFIEENGLRGRRCVHFDFGARLRAAASSDPPPAGLTEADRLIVRRSLASGALLEDEQAPLVMKILETFLLEKRLGPEDMVVLNGLPRHIGQAGAIDRVLEIEAVAVLECSAEVIVERIRRNAGGDRAGRPDDSTAEILAKLDIYRTRTYPLIRHYAERGAAILMVPVRADTGAREMSAILSQTSFLASM
jgi:adenylate kinase